MTELILKCLELFITFFKIGLFTFGGGYAMLPMMQEAVLEKNWATEAELINFIAVSESTPGPFAVNMSTYIGTEQAGFFGAFFATLGVVLPSFIIILIVARCYAKFQSSKIVKGCMSGLKPCVVGLIGAAVINIAATVLFPNGISYSAFSGANIYISLVIFALMAVLAFKKVHPILIICMSAVIGVAVGYGFNLTV
ncbi:MAG: chromate transporter [Clostridia bacterium]|nr:chromate transporter [Clostridia bacterium]MBQ4131844.1 chromate transporter [Clostridia bacterium]MBQ9920027.1 chromate transporter [Clostridia bacterium]